MKYFLVTLFVLMSIYQIYSSSISEWQAFKIKYGRNYSGKEDDYRRTVFEATQRRIAEHQQKFKKGLVSYEIGLNPFADWTNDEYLTGFDGHLKGEFGREEYAQRDLNNKRGLLSPNYVNYYDQGFRTPVRDQGRCSSCYVFSAIGSLEGQYFKKYNKLVKLSPQELMDCTKNYGNGGCKSGGWQSNNYRYMLQNGGIGLEDNNPYKGAEDVCRITKPRLTIKNYYEIPYANEWWMKMVVADVGPIPADMDARQPSFRSYTGGIYYDPGCSTNNLTHSVTVIGYGTTNDKKDYWIIKNSWGDWWGIKGYMYLARNANNHCGIATRSVYPVIN